MSTASTTITFAVVQPEDTSGAASISVELDDDANGGKSTFLPTDTAYFLVHTNPIGLAVTIDTTMGTVVSLSEKNVPVSDTLQFVNETEASLNKIPVTAVTSSWIGRAAGSPAFSEDKVTIPAAAIGILKCDYETTAKAYGLSGVTIPSGQEEIQVLVVVSPAT